jgi:drug/metabolite transporter (DMT)-like permease
MVALLGVLFALAAAVGLASQALFIRMGTRGSRPTDALVVVLVVDLLIFVPYAGVVYYPDYGLTVEALAAFAAAGVLAMMLGRAFLYAGIERVGASRAEPLKSSQAIPATVLGILLLGETASPIHLAGIGLIVVGVAVISSESTDTPITDTRDPRVGVGLVLLSALCFGLDAVLAEIGFTAGTPVFVAVAVKLIAGTLGFFAYLAARRDLPDASVLRGGDARWFAAAGVASAVFLFAFYSGLEVSQVVVVVPVMQASPLLVAVASYVFLQQLERVTLRLASGAVMVVAGTVAITVFG